MIMYIGRYYEVIEGEGIFKVGQRCYIQYEDEDFVWASFEYPVIGNTHQIKIPKTKINDTKIFQLT